MSELRPTIQRSGIVRYSIFCLLIGVLVVTATGSAAAVSEHLDPSSGMLLQQNQFLCESTDNPTPLGDIVDVLLTGFTYSAPVIFILLYQLDGVLSWLAVGTETKQKIKQHESRLWKGAGKIYGIPTIVGILVNAVGVPFPPSCISLFLL